MKLDLTERRAVLTEALSRLDQSIKARDFKQVVYEARFSKAMLTQIEAAAEAEQARVGYRP